MTDSLSTSAKKIWLENVDNFEHNVEAMEPVENRTGNSIVNMDILQLALQHIYICEACNSILSIQEKVSKRSGWAQSFTLACTNTNCEIQSIDIEPLKGDNKKIYPWMCPWI